MADLRPDARALIRAGKSAFRPQSGDRERVLVSLTRSLGEGAKVGTVRRTDPPAPAAAGPISSSWVLAGLGALTVGAGVLLATQPWATRRPTLAASASSSVAAVEAPSPSPAVPSIDAKDLPVQPRAEGRSMQSGTPSAAARTSSDSLPEEVRLLSKAEHQLTAGRADEALMTLAEHERRFPGGALAEERLAARVQSLCALGRVSEAKADLARLARSYPGSAQFERARKFCGIANP
jgi:hypothetical protein